jgi:hypothetical protein
MDEKPLILELGKRKKKDVKAFKKEGTGPIAAEVQTAVEQALSGSQGAGEVVPVVLLFEVKPKKSSLSNMPMMMPMSKMKFPSQVAKAFGLG